MTVSLDGLPGRMQIRLFNGPLSQGAKERDAALDAEIILHECSHQMCNRLVGHGVGLSGGGVPGGLAEGWCNFYALALLSQSTDNLDANYAFGAYSTWLWSLSSGTNAQNYYFGENRYPCTTDTGKNPLTFKDIDPTQASAYSAIPANPVFTSTPGDSLNIFTRMLELWGVTLWEVRAKLIQRYGFTAGNDLVLRLVMDGMKLSPPNPNFLQARDAILLADKVYNNGANRTELWQAFAKRGMGRRASAPPSTTSVGVVQSFVEPLPNGTIWTFNARGPVYSSPAIGSDGTVYVGGMDGKVYALNPNTGADRSGWPVTMGGSVYSSPAIASVVVLHRGNGVLIAGYQPERGAVYVGCSNNKLLALPAGTALAQSPWPTFRQNARHTATMPDLGTFLDSDDATQGNWTAWYGTQGYNIIADTTSYPAYAQVTPSGQSTVVWASSTTDPRALQKALSPTDRIAACWSAGTSFTIDVNVTDGLLHKFAMYFLDWDGNDSRAQRIDVYDAHSGFLIAVPRWGSFRTESTALGVLEVT